MRQDLGLGFGGLGKPLRQHQRNPLVKLLPPTLEQRLIGCFLDQCVLENIRRVGGHSPLIQQLSLHELC